MLQIKPCPDLELIAFYRKKCGRLPGPEHYLYLAADGDKTIAAALFEIEGGRVSAVYYEESAKPAGDAFLFDAVLRAGLNYAAGRGIFSGCLPEDFRAAHRDLLAKLRYPARSDFDIADFFKNHKNCNKM